MWRINEQSKHGYTWCDGQGIPKSRIDYVFISEEFDLDIASILTKKSPSIKNVRLSDHLAIKFDFTLKGEKIPLY